MCVHVCITKWLSFMWFVQTTFGHEGEREREGERKRLFPPFVYVYIYNVNVGEKKEWEQCGNSRRLSAIITRPLYCDSCRQGPISTREWANYSLGQYTNNIIGVHY